MNSAVYFNVPDSSVIAKQRCFQAINQLGAPLKSDSGHFITGVVTSGHNNVELRVTWLDAPGGTQVTVTASHDNLEEYELQNVAKRFEYEYLNKTGKRKRSGIRFSFSTFLVVASAVAALAMFVFAMMNRK